MMGNPPQPTPPPGLNGNLSAAQQKAQEILNIANACKYYCDSIYTHHSGNHVYRQCYTLLFVS